MGIVLSLLPLSFSGLFLIRGTMANVVTWLSSFIATVPGLAAWLAGYTFLE